MDVDPESHPLESVGAARRRESGPVTPAAAAQRYFIPSRIARWDRIDPWLTALSLLIMVLGSIAFLMATLLRHSSAALAIVIGAAVGGALHRFMMYAVSAEDSTGQAAALPRHGDPREPLTAVAAFSVRARCFVTANSLAAMAFLAFVFYRARLEIPIRGAILSVLVFGITPVFNLLAYHRFRILATERGLLLRSALTRERLIEWDDLVIGASPWSGRSHGASAGRPLCVLTFFSKRRGALVGRIAPSSSGYHAVHAYIRSRTRDDQWIESMSEIPSLPASAPNDV